MVTSSRSVAKLILDHEHLAEPELGGCRIRDGRSNEGGMMVDDGNAHNRGRNRRDELEAMAVLTPWPQEHIAQQHHPPTASSKIKNPGHSPSPQSLGDDVIG